jgi:hypothetical protein
MGMQLLWVEEVFAQFNQRPPAHQLGILSTGWGGISHLVVECALTFVDLNPKPFLGFFFFLLYVFFPNFEITCPTTYYLPSWPYLPMKNQFPPSHLPTRSTPPFPS